MRGEALQSALVIVLVQSVWVTIGVAAVTSAVIGVVVSPVLQQYFSLRQLVRSDRVGSYRAVLG
jgi:putative flippase GtrA